MTEAEIKELLKRLALAEANKNAGISSDDDIDARMEYAKFINTEDGIKWSTSRVNEINSIPAENRTPLDNKFLEEAATRAASINSRVSNGIDPSTKYLDLFNESIANAANDPKTLQLKKEGKISESLNGALTMFARSRDLVEARKQIQEGEKALKNLKKPDSPKAMAKSRELARSIENARVRADDASRETEGLRRGILDAYKADLGNAQIASTGQASTYGSLAQGAVNRRLRNELERNRVVGQTVRGNRAELSNLVDQSRAEDETIYNQNREIYDTKRIDYNNEARAAAGLTSTGRSNLRSSIYNAKDVIPYMAKGVSSFDGSNNSNLRNRIPDVRRGVQVGMNDRYGNPIVDHNVNPQLYGMNQLGEDTDQYDVYLSNQLLRSQNQRNRYDDGYVG